MHAFGISSQISLPPVVILYHPTLGGILDTTRGTFLCWYESSTFLTIADSKFLAFDMCIIFTNFASNGQAVFKPPTTEVTEFAFEVPRF
jgi:hypothetical protein